MSNFNSADIAAFKDVWVFCEQREDVYKRQGYISIQSHQIRQYTTNRQMQVDDYPYGGGRGAVMQADPLYRCWSHIVETYGPGRTIFLSPCGRTFTQEVAKELKARYRCV